MQASIAIVSCVLGLFAWWRTDLAGYLIGAVAIILPWPWTLLVMMPTNRLLEAMDVDAPTPRARPLTIIWGRMHLVRIAFGALATIVFLWTFQIG